MLHGGDGELSQGELLQLQLQDVVGACVGGWQVAGVRDRRLGRPSGAVLRPSTAAREEEEMKGSRGEAKIRAQTSQTPRTTAETYRTVLAERGIATALQ